MARQRYDYKDKTYEEVVNILGYGKPFYMLISNDKGEPVVYPVEYSFTHDKDFIYITAKESVLGDRFSFRINPKAKFEYEIEA